MIQLYKKIFFSLKDNFKMIQLYEKIFFSLKDNFKIIHYTVIGEYINTMKMNFFNIFYC